ncbi:MAG: branched-chain amino acid aminotransferase [Bordetella sp.]|nr:branched-chain amino acid aminotransferase [Bordetella sp.]
MNTPKTDNSARPAFGAVLADHMAVAAYGAGAWSPFDVRPTEAIPLHPGAHVLHYASTCFEGFKAYRAPHGRVNVFRMDRHIERLRRSARALALPVPATEQLDQMIRALIDRVRESVPQAPGALYLRPLLFGTMAAIGGAATPPREAMLVVIASPVWDYFAGGGKPLRIFVDDEHQRTAPHLGEVKAGANYAAAIRQTVRAREQHLADQVLFCPQGQVQETGAANFMLLRDKHLLTRSLDSSFLHGVTRDSLLTLARDEGWRVEERAFDLTEMLAWARAGEAALAGTAAVLAGVGTLIHRGVEHPVGDGGVGPITQALRTQLVDIQQGRTADRFGWLTPV